MSDAPSWLPVVRRRILDSVAPDDGLNASGDERYISRPIADAGLAFFDRTGDVLPGEPYLDSTNRGDLVAEFVIERPRLFRTERNRLTAIISTGYTILFHNRRGHATVRAGEDVRAALAAMLGI